MSLTRRQLLALAATGCAALALPAPAHALCGNVNCRTCYPRSLSEEVPGFETVVIRTPGGRRYTIFRRLPQV